VAESVGTCDRWLPTNPKAPGNFSAEKRHLFKQFAWLTARV
jgi:hypothetical protein